MKLLTTQQAAILIHTSVKLVTCGYADRDQAGRHFNPHEREARDDMD